MAYEEILTINSVDSALSETSIKPVQNKVIKAELSAIETNIEGKVANTRDGIGGALKLLSTNTDNIQDSDYIITQTGTANPVRKTAGTMWTYVEDKLHPRILEQTTDYGATLPSSPVDGQLFFQETTATSLLNLMYPVGSIYLSVNNTNPQTLFGGTWVQLKDRFLLGAGSTYTNGATGGEATHKLTVSEMPSHMHDWNGYTGMSSAVDNATYKLPINGTSSWKAQSFYSSDKGPQSTGGDAAHNNMPPYLVVYMWKRTA